MHGRSAGPRVLAGKYCLADRIAQGGMGAVWRAEHLQLRRPVAVKLMSPKMLGSGAFRARFEREALAAAQLRTRHVVTIHDYGFDGDEPFIVMELLDGEDLSTRLRRVTKLPAEATAAIVVQIARALERAHAAGLVHRDLKPANVFLARIDDEEIVKVLDFGIAKAFGEGAADEVTGDDEVLGTPLYMSPEQIRKSSPIDPRSDLWALSVIAYRLLTGAQPFNGDTRGDIVVRVCTAPHAPPSTLDPSLGPAVDAFFERALSKSPDDRFDSARVLAAALDAALGTGSAAHVSWQRASLAEIPASALPVFPAYPTPPSTGASPSAAALLTPPATPGSTGGLTPETDYTLSPRSTHVGPALITPGSRHRRLVVGLAIAALSAAIAVTLGLSVLGAGDDDPQAGAAAPSSSAEPSTAALPTPAPSPSVVPSDSPTASSSATSAAPLSSASGAASGSATAAPSVAPGAAKQAPNKRRKVVLGL